jgi:hypothetical protein
MWIDIFGSQRVLLQIEQLLLSEFGIVVNTDFGINAIDLIFWIDSPWVDLKLHSIAFGEQSIQISDLISETFNLVQVKVLLDFS